jgi:GNAT superfamily N-acetyltransferase
MIRPLEARDKAAVMGLIRETGFFTEPETDVAEELIDISLDRPGQKDYVIVVSEDGGGRPDGFLIYGPTPLTEGTYDLYWMAVAPQMQGKGLGKEFVRWTEERVKEADGRMLLIETASQPKYEPTRRFYIGLGYREVARVPDFYKPGDDRIIYAKVFDRERSS